MEWSIIFFILSMVSIIVFRAIHLENKVKALENRLARIEREVDLPEHPVYQELRENIRMGKEVQAVKLARQTFGLSLIEGKQLVDELRSESLESHSQKG